MNKVYERMTLRLIEAKKLMMEGPKYGSSPTQTGETVGKAMNQFYDKQRKKPGEEWMDAVNKKRTQVKRIKKKVADRQVRNWGAVGMINPDPGTERDTRDDVGGMEFTGHSGDIRDTADKIHTQAKNRFRRAYRAHREEFKKKKAPETDKD